MLKCPECGAEMVLRETKKFKTKGGKPRKFYGCSNYPNCTATHGAHPDGKPLGIPANKEVKLLRMEAHRLCEKWYGKWDSKDCDREGMYVFLKNHTKSGHIAGMGKEELVELIAKLKEKGEF